MRSGRFPRRTAPAQATFAEMAGNAAPSRPPGARALPGPVCRNCGAALATTFVDLGASPLCERFLRPEQLSQPEPFYSLHVWACDACSLVQLESFVPPEEIFTEYAYFSAYSDSWVEHARCYVQEIVPRLDLGPGDLVVELASNDGYLLQHLLGTGIPMLGIDPARNVARVAQDRGVPTLVDFFGRRVARELVADGRTASLVVGNNVLAQVPDLHDFVGGVQLLLRPGGTATFEFPHLLRLIEGVQYDTIYHEHFSYFSLASAADVFRRHGLLVVDVDELPTHGGSLRLYVRHAGEGVGPSAAVHELEEREEAAGINDESTHRRFAEAVQESKRALLDLLIELRRAGRHVVGYGAPGKGNTLLNYCGIGTDFLDYVVDRNPYKHGLYTPGTRIPIHPVERLAETRPDCIVVLPWNLVDEIAAQLEPTLDWSTELIVPIPTARTIDPNAVSFSTAG